MKASKKSTPLNRIKYVGTDEPPTHLTDGNLLIELPTDQSKPFSHKYAKRILAVAPEQYKPVIPKGKK